MRKSGHPRGQQDQPLAESANADNGESSAYSYQDYERQQRDIEESYEHLPAVARPAPIIETLGAKLSQGMQVKLLHLAQNFPSVLSVRPDGNCFYRGFCFGLVLQAAIDGKLPWLISVVAETANLILTIPGVQRYIADDMVDQVSGSLRDVQAVLQQYLENDARSEMQSNNNRVNSSSEDKRPASGACNQNCLAAHALDAVLNAFNEPGISAYFVSWSRIVTSAFLRLHAEEFSPFLPEPYYAMDEFCAVEVEPMGKEADHLQIMACVQAIGGVGICIHYLDSNSTSSMTTHEFGTTEPGSAVLSVPIHFLYRPGHYDLLI